MTRAVLIRSKDPLEVPSKVRIAYFRDASRFSDSTKRMAQSEAQLRKSEGLSIRGVRSASNSPKVAHWEEQPKVPQKQRKERNPVLLMHRG